MKLYKLVIFILLGIYSSFVVGVDHNLVKIATGNVTGIYYRAGGAICQSLKRYTDLENCFVRSTSGTVNNIKLLLKGDVDLAIIQSDFLSNRKLRKSELLREIENANLRALFNLHTDSFVILVRNKSGIRKFNDIKEKIVNIGATGSGVRSILEYIMELKGWTYKDFSETTELKASKQSEALCSGKVDVTIYAVGNPSPEIQYATSKCPTRLISIDDSEIEKSIKFNKNYVPEYIHGGLYKGNDEDIKTFGVQALMVVKNEYDEDFVYKIVKNFFENIEYFKVQHPVFKDLNPKEMVKVTSMPLHPGALKYYKEVGWIK